MKTYRKTAVIVGILFIVGTVSGILSGAFTAPILAGSTYLFNLEANETQWIIGTLLVLLMGLSLSMVSILLYPVGKNHNEILALGYVVFRGALEMGCVTIHVVSMLLLLTVSQMYGNSGAAGASSLQNMGSMLIATGNWIQIIGGLIFSLGALMIYALFYQTRLIPRWLSAWGLIGGVLYFAANLVSMFGPLHAAPSIESGIGLLLIPLAIQEMVFAAWLIAKGFNPSMVSARPAKTEANELLSAA
jgi:hypothetical protein